LSFDVALFLARFAYFAVASPFERSRRYAEAEKIPLRFLRNSRDAENDGGESGEVGNDAENIGCEDGNDAENGDKTGEGGNDDENVGETGAATEKIGGSAGATLRILRREVLPLFRASDRQTVDVRGVRLRSLVPAARRRVGFRRGRRLVFARSHAV
jgi:hypothetical protein